MTRMILVLFALVATACTPETTAAPGEWPNPETWNSAVVVTNLGPEGAPAASGPRNPA